MSSHSDDDESACDRVYAFVSKVPHGRVVTYSQVGECVAGGRLSPREVGAAMACAPSGIPWHRVLGSDGTLRVARRSAELAVEQRRLLEAEGVEFLPRSGNAVDLGRWQWTALTA